MCLPACGKTAGFETQVVPSPAAARDKGSGFAPVPGTTVSRMGMTGSWLRGISIAVPIQLRFQRRHPVYTFIRDASGEGAGDVIGFDFHPDENVDVAFAR